LLKAATDVILMILIVFVVCHLEIKTWKIMFIMIKVCVALHGTPSHSYRVSLAICDHTVLPATWHKWTHPDLTPDRLVLVLSTPEGLKAGST